MKNIFKLPTKILIASNNAGKLVEISALLKQINIEAVTPPASLAEPDETGSTFAQNSLLKAKYYAKNCNMVAIADDSGLCIEALDGAPGIHSARFALDEHGEKNFLAAFEKIRTSLEKQGLNPNSCRAYFICNLTIFDPQSEENISFEGRVDGALTFPARGVKGFGYDPIFIKNGLDKTFGEIAPELKDEISHRGDAFQKFREYFKSEFKSLSTND